MKNLFLKVSLIFIVIGTVLSAKAEQGQIDVFNSQIKGVFQAFEVWAHNCYKFGQERKDLELKYSNMIKKGTSDSNDATVLLTRIKNLDDYCLRKPSENLDKTK